MCAIRPILSINAYSPIPKLIIFSNLFIFTFDTINRKNILSFGYPKRLTLFLLRKHIGSNNQNEAVRVNIKSNSINLQQHTLSSHYHHYVAYSA